MKTKELKSLTLAGLIIVLWIICLVWSMSFTPNNNALKTFLFLAQTFLSVGLFIISHDCMHSSLSSNQSLNKKIGQFSMYLYAAFSYEKLKVNHFRHHNYPVTDSDPDYSKDERISQWLIKFFKEYYGIKEFLYMHGHILLIFLINGFSLSKLFIFYVFPVLLSALQLFYFGTYLPHRTKTPHTNKHNARSNSLPKWLSLVTCYHFGYHFEHHEYPQTPWWELPMRRYPKEVL